MSKSLTKEGLKECLVGLGAYEVRVADPRQGFEHAVPGRHPLEILPECRSVVVFIVPRTVWTNNTAVSLTNPGSHQGMPDKLPLSHRLFYTPGRTAVSIHELLSERIWYAGANLLRANGHQVGQGYVQEKLSAYEAGLGIYGRSGLILHSVLGNRISPGVLLTDAVFEPDPKVSGFEPCSACRVCIQACPAAAFQEGRAYPGNWSRETCLSKRGQFAAEGVYCHECFRSCPAGGVEDEDLATVRSLQSLGEKRGVGSIRKGG